MSEIDKIGYSFETIRQLLQQIHVVELYTMAYCIHGNIINSHMILFMVGKIM